MINGGNEGLSGRLSTPTQKDCTGLGNAQLRMWIDDGIAARELHSFFNMH